MALMMDATPRATPRSKRRTAGVQAVAADYDSAAAKAARAKKPLLAPGWDKAGDEDLIAQLDGAEESNDPRVSAAATQIQAELKRRRDEQAAEAEAKVGQAKTAADASIRQTEATEAGQIAARRVPATLPPDVAGVYPHLRGATQAAVGSLSPHAPLSAHTALLGGDRTGLGVAGRDLPAGAGTRAGEKVYKPKEGSPLFNDPGTMPQGEKGKVIAPRVWDTKSKEETLRIAGKAKEETDQAATARTRAAELNTLGDAAARSGDTDKAEQYYKMGRDHQAHADAHEATAESHRESMKPKAAGQDSIDRVMREKGIGKDAARRIVEYGDIGPGSVTARVKERMAGLEAGAPFAAVRARREGERTPTVLHTPGGRAMLEIARKSRPGMFPGEWETTVATIAQDEALGKFGMGGKGAGGREQLVWMGDDEKGWTMHNVVTDEDGRRHLVPVTQAAPQPDTSGFLLPPEGLAPGTMGLNGQPPVMPAQTTGPIPPQSQQTGPIPGTQQVSGPVQPAAMPQPAAPPQPVAPTPAPAAPTPAPPQAQPGQVVNGKVAATREEVLYAAQVVGRDAAKIEAYLNALGKTGMFEPSPGTVRP